MTLVMSTYILAGGRSSRFGSDKARATLDGIPLISRIAETARHCTHGVNVVADVVDKYSDLGLRTIADSRSGVGPIAGLESALRDAASRGDEWIFVASCDLLDLKPEWIERLRSHCESPAEFAAFRHQFWEPLIACYHIALITRIEVQLQKGESALWKLLEVANGNILPLPEGWPAQVQANTPKELSAEIKRRKTAASNGYLIESGVNYETQ